MLKNAFVSRDAQTWKKLYTSYVRPHLEFGITAWSPYTQKDIICLEKVQQRATKLIHALRGLSYDQRCESLGIPNLTDRRIRGDLIQFFKFENKFDEIIWHNSPLVTSSRSGRRPQLRREIVRCCNQRHNFFINRVVNQWNALPDNVTNSNTVDQFKNNFDTYTKTAIGRR